MNKKMVCVLVFLFIISCLCSAPESRTPDMSEPTKTRQPTKKPQPTRTPQPTPTLTDYDLRDLITYPDNYRGARVYISGKVFNVIDDQNLQIYVGENQDAVFIYSKVPYQMIYEDDLITAHGYVKGKHCGKNVFGGEICQPLIIDAEVNKVE